MDVTARLADIDVVEKACRILELSKGISEGRPLWLEASKLLNALRKPLNR